MGRITVRVTPRAREDSVTGWQDGVLRVRVRAPAEQGKANEAVCRLIAETLDVPARNVILIRGAGHREKLIEVGDIPQQEIERRLHRDRISRQSSGIMKW